MPCLSPVFLLIVPISLRHYCQKQSFIIPCVIFHTGLWMLCLINKIAGSKFNWLLAGRPCILILISPLVICPWRALLPGSHCGRYYAGAAGCGRSATRYMRLRCQLEDMAACELENWMTTPTMSEGPVVRWINKGKSLNDRDIGFYRSKSSVCLRTEYRNLASFEEFSLMKSCSIPLQKLRISVVYRFINTCFELFCKRFLRSFVLCLVFLIKNIFCYYIVFCFR